MIDLIRARPSLLLLLIAATFALVAVLARAGNEYWWLTGCALARLWVAAWIAWTLRRRWQHAATQP